MRTIGSAILRVLGYCCAMWACVTAALIALAPDRAFEIVQATALAHLAIGAVMVAFIPFAALLVYFANATGWKEWLGWAVVIGLSLLFPFRVLTIFPEPTWCDWMTPTVTVVGFIYWIASRRIPRIAARAPR